MSAAWVAGSVRARSIALRAIGLDAAQEIAARPSLTTAVKDLGPTAYGRAVRESATLAAAQHAVAATLLWHIRVLAGWLPAAGVSAMRTLAGWFEIANVDEHLRALAGLPAEPPYRLGMLATAWPRLAATGSAAQLRAGLVAGGWRDPGGEGARDIQLGMRLAWADRVRIRVPAAAAWALGGAALLVARERFALGRDLPPGPQAAAVRLLGRGVTAGGSVPDLAAALAPAGAAALAGIRDPADLWLAEVRWWARLRTQGRRLLASPGTGPARAVGAIGVLAGDAWLVRAALACAARGGTATTAAQGDLATLAAQGDPATAAAQGDPATGAAHRGGADVFDALA